MRVGVVGWPYYARAFVRYLQQSGTEARIFSTSKQSWVRDFRSIDVLFGFGSIYRAPRAFVGARLLGQRTVVHWIGTDVLNVVNRPVDRIQALFLNRFVNLHLAASRLLVDELGTVGVTAREFPFISPKLNFGPCPPMPDVFTVLTYLPGDRFDFYGGPLVGRLAQELPEIQFVAVGDGINHLATLPNVEHLGLVEDMTPVFEQTSLLLRVIEHDGCPLMVQEALSYGRHVICWPYSLPVAYVTHDPEAILTKLRELASSNTGPDLAARDYAHPYFSRELISERLIPMLQLSDIA
jgi:hypothetical protein